MGYQGHNCTECSLLPGCVHGRCDRPLECICEEGWEGEFCNVPICRQGCHPIFGSCHVSKAGYLPRSSWINHCLFDIISPHINNHSNLTGCRSPASASVAPGTRASSATSASPTRAACTAPATSPGPATARKAGRGSRARCPRRRRQRWRTSPRTRRRWRGRRRSSRIGR